MFHFLISFDGEVKAFTAAALPRVGDTIVVEGSHLTIERVEWYVSDNTLDNGPLVVTQSVLSTTADLEALARRIIKANRVLSPRTTETGNKIQAIKELRATAEIGLKEAKEEIDRLWNVV